MKISLWFERVRNVVERNVGEITANSLISRKQCNNNNREGLATWRFWLKYIFNYRTGARGCFPHSSLCFNGIRAPKKTFTQRKQLIIQSVHRRYEEKVDGCKIDGQLLFVSLFNFYLNSFFINSYCFQWYK